MTKNYFLKRGFHLIEILITLSIIAILTAISLPLYSHYLIKTKRFAVINELSKISIALEHYYAEHNTYHGATLASLNSDLNRDYQLDFLITENTYSLTATPIARQAKEDKECGALTINSLGEKMISGSGNVEECW